MLSTELQYSLLTLLGGLTARLDLLKENLLLSLITAATGSAAPIALSFVLLYLGFGYGAVETFIIGAALSCTSLGTTVVVLKESSRGVNITQTRAGTVLLSAAVIDDVAGLVMASVIQSLGDASETGDINLGWIIGRPIVVSVAMTVLTPLLARCLLRTGYCRFVEPHITKWGYPPMMIFMAAILCAFLSISSYAGTSVLYGSFLAGMLVPYLPTDAEDQHGATKAMESAAHMRHHETLTFQNVFEHFLLDVQLYVLQALFFASTGFAIPFLGMWSGRAIWRGIAFSILMMLARLVVGIYLPLWTFMCRPREKSPHERHSGSNHGSRIRQVITPALLVGLAMVARGEIGLLIIQIGLNETTYLSQEAFITAI